MHMGTFFLAREKEKADSFHCNTVGLMSQRYQTALWKTTLMGNPWHMQE